MKMGGSVLFGLFFVLFGISILLRIFFGLNIPLVRTAFALFIVYIGIRMLVGGDWGIRANWARKDSHNVTFDHSDFTFEPSARNHYSTVFGSSTVDLRNAAAENKDLEIHVSTVFGETKVIVDSSKPYSIRANAAFGEVKMPNDNMVAFGTLNYASPSAAGPSATSKTNTRHAGAQNSGASNSWASSSDSPNSHRIKIHGNVVFGSLRFVEAGEGWDKSDATHDDDRD
jgi:hypothetical protein